MWSKLLHSAVSHDSNAVSPSSSSTNLRCRHECPFGGEHGPVTVLTGLVVSSKPPVTHRVRFGGPTKPSTSDHRVHAACAATAGGVWVLPEEHGILEHLDIIPTSPLYLAAEEPPWNLRHSTVFRRITYFLHEGGHGSCGWSRPDLLRTLGVFNAPENL